MKCFVFVSVGLFNLFMLYCVAIKHIHEVTVFILNNVLLIIVIAD